ncbi:hypothetical protein [Ruminiclostridium josui]|uniref:hypothetical protein n=1 Tax=Ruminiclostridium josui TaxID=1499 RepID=UPI000463591C|nr:hypothetical protein [Ruminiclostridium josui]
MNDTQIALLSAGAGLTGALVGFIGAIVSGHIGGKWSYKGAMDAVTREITEERNRLKEQKKENKILAEFFINSFLIQEIERNYTQIDDRLMMALNSGLKQGPPNLNWSYKFYFDEYDKVKYDLVKFNAEIINDYSYIYKLFAILANKRNYYDLTENERKFVAKALRKCKEILKNKDAEYNQT